MSTRTWLGTTNGNFATATNWVPNGSPGNGDVLWFDGTSAVNVDAGLSTALTTLTIHVTQAYLGLIGTIASGVATYLVIAGGTIYVGEDTGSTTLPAGSQQVLIDTGSTAATANILNTNSASVLGNLPPVMLKGTSLTVNATGGACGVAAFTGDTATATAINLTDGPATLPPSVYLGSGCTPTAITAGAGTILSLSDQTHAAVTLTGSATMRMQGVGAATTVSIGGGARLQHYGSGNITTVNNSGTVDRTGSTATVTFTTSNAYPGSAWLLDNGKPSSTVRTTVTFQNCRIQDMTWQLPLNEKI